MISCFPVLRGAQQLQLCCCQYVSIIYSLKLYCFRLVPLIYDVMMWALNMQDWLYFFWAYWASWVWAGHEDTDTWHEDTNLCRTCDILTRSLVFDTSNMSVAQTVQKLASYWSAKCLWFTTGATGLQQRPTGCHRGQRGQQEATGEVSWWLQAPQNMITSAYIMICEDIEGKFMVHFGLHINLFHKP